MPSPFPGMDPYLEDPELWPDVHHELISQNRTALNPVLLTRYVARVELRIYLSDENDPGQAHRVPNVRIEKPSRRKGVSKAKREETLAVAEPMTIPFLTEEKIEEARLEIRQPESNALVTVIEVLSPSNKVRGSYGRKSFLKKRREVLASEVHWVEIDLLRAGVPSLLRLEQPRCDYRIVVARYEKYRSGKLWPVSVRQALPIVGIPLRGKDGEIPLDLGAVLNAAYDNAAYDVTLDYRREPIPPLAKADAVWAAKLLREKGLR